MKTKTSKQEMKNSILLVDDHPVFRKGLRSLLDDEEDMHVVGEAGDGQEALTLIEKLSPDVVVMDVTMPGLNGIETTKRIISDFPGVTTVVALSIHSEKEFVQDMLQAGASGYILKESVPEELVKGIRSVMVGEGYLSPAITGIIVSQFRKSFSHDQTAQELDYGFVETKLHAPNLQGIHVIRKRLVHFFEENRHLPLQVVIAPAGYGKSTIVSQWLFQHEWPNAWLSLDEHDSDLRQFMVCLVHAVRTLFPNSLLKTGAYVDSGRFPPLQSLAATLVNEISVIQDDFILVMDDFHLIKEKAIHDLISELSKHPSSFMHLVIIGRTDPFLPVTKFRAQGLVTEIRLKDLQFTEKETMQFLAGYLEQNIDEPVAISWHKKTEGWITGLRLAALSVRHQDDLDNLLHEVPGSGQYIKEYLFKEVLEQQPENIRKHIVLISILDRFSAPLFEVLCPYSKSECKFDGWGVMNWLDKHNLFHIPLDNRRYWFRFHHLFQELLQGQLNRHYSSDDIKELHFKAGSWFAENGYLEEAIKHTLLSGKAEKAGKLVERIGHMLIEQERVFDLEKILWQLPSKVIEDSPLLLIYEAWIARVNLLFPKIAAYLKKAEESASRKPLPEDISDVVSGYLYSIRSYERYCLLDPEAAQSCAEQALELIPSQYSYMRGFATIMQTAVLQMKGRYQDALSVMKSAQNDRFLQPKQTQAVLLAGLSPICMMEADEFTLRTVANRLMKLGKETGLTVNASWGRQYLAVSHYQRNEIEEAVRILASYQEDCYLMYHDAVVDGAVILSLCYQILSQPQEAREVADFLSQHAVETGHPLLLLAAEAFQAELALQQGRLDNALSWVRLFEPRHLHAHYFFYLPELTCAKVLIREDTPTSLQKAQDLLLGIEKFSRNTNNRSILIPALALQAILLDKHDQPEALEKAAESISLAKPGGGIRFFLDLGLPMENLFHRLLEQKSSMNFIEKLLAAFSEDKQRSPMQSTDGEAQNIPLLDDPLTIREQEILNQLSQGKTNKEIAENLFISIDTVKTHLKKIYQKLEVNSRLQAVTKATELGIGIENK